MKKRQRTRKSLSLKKRIVGYFAIAVIVLGVVGGFSINHVIAESTNNSGGVARSEAVVANKGSDDSPGASDAHVLVTDDNTGDSTGPTVKDVGYTPSVNVNNMSSYPQTGDAHEYGYVIMGFSILIGLFAFYMKKFHRFTTD
ncbi:LPXTG cell wall anchor domain-containing protein [Companilactobacillus insicii]|uniref:LPXTG cell wall anchor domain-containing protein n=1 Tax=Companilactobacillus insicii TaxID=1732567 RepID=UPI000F7A8470|nr:LPXTG cell wall anchor domain-containing protein [Companilactobacillus insicii]